MRKAVLFSKIVCLLVAIFNFNTLKAIEKTQLPIPSQDSLERSMVGKTVWDILAESYKYSLPNMELALAYANLALDKARKSGNKKDIFDAQRNIGFIYEDNALPTQYIAAYEEAARLAEILPDSFKTTIYNDLAIVHRKHGNYRVAFEYYEKVLSIAEKIKDYEMISSTYHGLGTLHRETGVYDRAANYYLKSLEISVKMQSLKNIIISHKDLSETYLKAKDYEKALAHIQKAYQSALLQRESATKNVETSVQLANVLNCHGAILFQRGDSKEALEKYNEALTIYKSIDYKLYIARTLMLVADVYFKKQAYEQVATTYKECLSYESHFLESDRTELHYKIGLLHRQQNKSNEAEAAFLKSLKIAEKFDYKEIAQRANYQMFLLCLDKHENPRALLYLNAANALNDSLFNADRTRQTAEMELKFDTEKRENEINTLKARETRFLLIVSISAFLMIVLFLGFWLQMRGRSFRAMKLKNNEIQQQYKRLEESNEILSQFAYVAAHDLKEPLRSIGSYVGLIQMKYAKDLPPDAKEYMQFVNSGVKRMYSLLTDLLDFSQVISQQPGAEVIRPDEVLEDVKANLRNAIESKNAQVVCMENLPSIRMNRSHLLQLFQNLIGNALKFTTTEPLVKIEGREENGHVLLTIEDNGIGINKEYGNKVFVLFQQLNKKDRFDGTGIGLTICKNIVEKYNGRIWFDSEENIGTKFYISIPANAA
ncbi:MAG: tetratricopeptide repeat protein [Saprospiraceae bacterium]|nr:tetratricopeptide repeat protein [Saprospiraceae bacterium]